MAVRSSQGITFSVDTVDPATTRLAETKVYDATSSLLGSPIEACFNYSTDVVADVEYHPFFAAAHLAHSEHRPLVLSPDMIWILILQGLAMHVGLNAESLRPKLVPHEGRIKLAVSRRDFVEGSPDNDWAGAFEGFSSAIREMIGEQRHEWLPCNFSTSGPVEQAVGNLAILDVFKQYYDFVVYAVCGIPKITLEGSTQDWMTIRSRIDKLDDLDLSWWTEHLRPIAGEFVLASQGQVNLEHWKNIFKLEKQYGFDRINGWLIKLIPYLKDGVTRHPTERNPALIGATQKDDEDSGVTYNRLPTGLSCVPFRFQGFSEDVSMEAVGGFLGIKQDHDLALKPVIGWAVRKADPKIQAMERFLAAADKVTPQSGERVSDFIFGQFCFDSFPAELIFLYIRTDGGLYKNLQILSLESLSPMEDDAHGDILFARTSDGQEISCNKHMGWLVKRWRNGSFIVIAESLGEFFTKVLDSGPTYWLDEGFVPYRYSERFWVPEYGGYREKVRKFVDPASRIESGVTNPDLRDEVVDWIERTVDTEMLKAICISESEFPPKKGFWVKARDFLVSHFPQGVLPDHVGMILRNGEEADALSKFLARVKPLVESKAALQSALTEADFTSAEWPEIVHLGSNFLALTGDT